ncbi:ATP-binding protein [Novosphingobium sp. M1R2S20]|uniref:ATP-binding protein n=1 Tax=Novosphingobium rhizovicinum TaxID=3228928 RepID=A0ABV3RFQ3_9SPHN
MSVAVTPGRAMPGLFVRALVPRRGDLALLAVYALAFALLHWSASPWGGAGFFSLWYPAAGLRFAVLWYRGAALAPWLMATELGVDFLTGTISLTSPMLLQEVIGVLRPGVAYAAAVGMVHWLVHHRKGALTLPPLAFGLAAVCAPVFNALSVLLAEALVPSSSTAYRAGADIAVALTGLTVGDLLGVLVLAPALLWFAGVLDGSTPPRIPPPRAQPVLESIAVMGVCLLLAAPLWRAGLGAQPLPTLLAGAWIGLRFGRAAAWLTILAEVLVFLPYSIGSVGNSSRLDLHLDMAAVVLITWLAGSFADAQNASNALLTKRNRLLYQAERLKTLRAMSVAVIHEISQPLSTLTIEAGHLRERTAGLDADITASAELVDRKAHTLSEMVRRLRRFGGRDVDEPSVVPIAMLIDTARQIVASDLKARAARLEVAPISPDLSVQAQEIELTQVLVNLLRNGAAAASGRTIDLTVQDEQENVKIIVANPKPHPGASAVQEPGMGVGLIIARTIVEAHGGTLVREDTSQTVHFVLTLPLAGAIA